MGKEKNKKGNARRPRIGKLAPSHKKSGGWKNQKGGLLKQERRLKFDHFRVQREKTFTDVTGKTNLQVNKSLREGNGRNLRGLHCRMVGGQQP